MTKIKDLPITASSKRKIRSFIKDKELDLIYQQRNNDIVLAQFNTADRTYKYLLITDFNKKISSNSDAFIIRLRELNDNMWLKIEL